jgi:hypothetical protein
MSDASPGPEFFEQLRKTSFSTESVESGRSVGLHSANSQHFSRRVASGTPAAVDCIRVALRRSQIGPALELIDRLGQDEDMHKIYLPLA